MRNGLLDIAEKYKVSITIEPVSPGEFKLTLRREENMCVVSYKEGHIKSMIEAERHIEFFLEHCIKVIYSDDFSRDVMEEDINEQDDQE